jgi:apolipoprotein N-acyltransferase
MMPVQAVPTLYSRIGDVFAWLAIVALIGLTIRAIFGRRTTIRFSRPQSVEAPLPLG